MLCAQKILSDIKSEADLPVEVNDVLSMMENSEVSPSPSFVDALLTTTKFYSKTPELIDSYKPDQVAKEILYLFNDLLK